MRIFICFLFCTVFASASHARTWTVEKDGSGDFTVIQDALDAAASGDSVLVGPGRFADFRPGASTVDGFQFQAIAWITKDDVSLVGSGAEASQVGPSTFVSEVAGLPAGGLYVDAGSNAIVSGFRIENTLGRVTIRRKMTLGECSISKEDPNTYFAVSLLEGDQILIRNCQFFGPRSIITSTPAVTGPRIEDCSFDNPGLDGTSIVIGNGATGAYISTCTINGYAAGIQTSLGGTATIEDSHFTAVRVGALDLSDGLMIVRRCVIEAGSRFPLRAGAGRLEVYDTIIGGGTMATLLTWTEVYMRNCHLLNGGALTVDSRGSAARVNDLRSNWWGSLDLQQIDAWISELNPNVLYEPILEQPVPTQTRSLSSLKALFQSP